MIGECNSLKNNEVKMRERPNKKKMFYRFDKKLISCIGDKMEACKRVCYYLNFAYKVSI